MDIVIGLIGAKGSGKTTALNFMKDTFPESITEITLAKKLKTVCSKISDIPEDFFENPHKKEESLKTPFFLTEEKIKRIFEEYHLKNMPYDSYVRPHIDTVCYTPRQIAQYVGTELLRSFDPDIHCKTAIVGKQGKVGVVTDIRFPNELAFFRKFSNNFFPIYIRNVGAEVKASTDTHASESYLQELAKEAILLNNNTTLTSYKSQIVQVVESIMREIGD